MIGGRTGVAEIVKGKVEVDISPLKLILLLLQPSQKVPTVLTENLENPTTGLGTMMGDGTAKISEIIKTTKFKIIHP